MIKISARGECQAGNSFANGSPLPAFLRYNPEFREIFEARYCLWTVMA